MTLPAVQPYHHPQDESPISTQFCFKLFFRQLLAPVLEKMRGGCTTGRPATTKGDFVGQQLSEALKFSASFGQLFDLILRYITDFLAGKHKMHVFLCYPTVE